MSDKGRGLIISLLVFIAVAIFITAGVVGFYVFGNRNTAAGPGTEKKPDEITLKLDEFVVKLAGEQRSFIKITINLAYTNKKVTEQINENMPQIRHIINTTLMSKTPKDLDVVGIEALNKEIMAKLNLLLGFERITNIYINDIIIQ